MPPGKTRTPWARPDLETVVARSLPQREVARVPLSRINLSARPREQLVDGVARKPPVGGEAGDVVVDGSTHLVGMSLGDQGADEVEHLRDIRGCMRVVVGGPDVDEGGVLHERFRVVGGDLLRRLALQSRRDKHLVLAAIEGVVSQVPDVGDVHHLLGAVAEILEAAAQQVREHERAQVADVDVSVDRGPARIDAHQSRLDGLQLVLLPGQRAV